MSQFVLLSDLNKSKLIHCPSQGMTAIVVGKAGLGKKERIFAPNKMHFFGM